MAEAYSKESLMREALMVAGGGDIDALYWFMQQHPLLLREFENLPLVHNPLHEAAKAGQTRVALELMNIVPSLARKLNHQGLSPLDLAVTEEDRADETGAAKERRQRKNETAKALIKLDRELIRVKGKKMMTPMHHAVIEANEDLLAEFLCACPGSIDDLTNTSQTAVHLAVENKKREIFYLLLGWLRRRHREDVLRWEDEDGNNVLHIAVETGQTEMVNKLVKKIARIRRNSKKLTALDIADQKGNAVMKNLLIRGGVRDNDHNFLTDEETLPCFLKSEEGSLEKAFRWYIYMKSELTVEMVNVFLVVAVLIVTAAYQGVLSPPGGLWQGEGKTGDEAQPPPLPLDMQYPQMRKYNHVGKVTASPSSFNAFMIGNTIAFISAIWVITAVIPGVPAVTGLIVSLIFLTYSYLRAVLMISEPNIITLLLVIFTSFLTLVGVALKAFFFFRNSLFHMPWWMPSFSVEMSNYLYQVTDNRLIRGLTWYARRYKLHLKACKLEHRRSAGTS